MSRIALAVALALSLGCSHAAKETRAEPKAKSYPDVPNMNDRRWANGLEKAAKELGVPANEVAHQPLDNGRFVFQAGGKQVEYALFCMGLSCAWLDDPRSRAAFDLDCPKERLSITYIDEKTRGISGCEKRGTYLMTYTPGTYDTRWVMNSSAGK